MRLDKDLIRVFVESALVAGILAWVVYWIFAS